MLIRFAQLLSLIGHPLLTVPLVAGVVVLHHQNSTTAFWVIGLMAAVVVPLALHMYRSSRRGTYTNFDVSNRSQRRSWYRIVALLLILLLIALPFTGLPVAVRNGFLPFVGLALVSQIVNRVLKTSLHVGFNVLLVFLLLPVSGAAALGYALFSGGLAWSRVALHRHTVLEVCSGAVLGALFGWWLCAGVG